MKFIAIIPARAGSKRLPRKNTRLFRSKPLIEWTIEAATRSSNVDQVWVTTDDPKILNKHFNGLSGMRKRPSYLAKDNSQMVDVVLDLLRSPPIKKEGFTHFILLQPTSPLRTTKHIDEAIKLITRSKSTSLFSVVRSKSHPWKCLLVNNGRLTPAKDRKYLNQNLQSLPMAVSQNGAIYIAKISHFEKHKSFFLNECVPYFMDDKSSLDIDTAEDLRGL